MPFKLKLKKTRQYNVASKNLFVISVELLDGGVADCTLSVDSTGQECLDNVCQRQAINQPEFFGLRYVNRNQQPRWVQLERPLKRQLEKYASSHQLFLRVMYYVVSGTVLITDEVTRYHYFLQLKNDLIEGRIICDCQQAVVLASYSRQAEYGNHDRERHTVEYLKNLLTFPKQMIDGGQVIESSALAESGKLDWLTSAVIQHHMTLHNMSQAQAEEGFISACQQLRGYGQEVFVAQDQLKQAEVTISISLSGITVMSETGDSSHFYRWNDITNVINHKRSFSIECARAGDSRSFSLRDPELGKYVWRVCVLQHTAYMRHQPPATAAGTRNQTHFQEHGLSESREELDPSRYTANSVGSVALTAAHRARSTSCLELQHQQPGRALLPSYRPAPDYETAIQLKYQQQRDQIRFTTHGPPGPPAKPYGPPAKPYGSHPDIHRIHYPDVTRHTVSQGLTTDDYAYGRFVNNSYTPFAVNPNVQTDLHYINVYKPPPPYPSNGLASNSTPDLAVASQLNYHRGYINSHVSGSSPDLVSTRTALNRQYLGYLNGNVNMVNYTRPVMASTHGTYNNLASVLDPNPHIILDPHHISDIQKVYDDRGNIMYSMPMHRTYQRHVVLPTNQVPKLTDTPEPIYENVPLPWQSRHRARSLSSTDEITRLNERNGSQPAINTKQTDTDSHYVNQAVTLDNVTLSTERLSLRDSDVTPYQSLSTHKVNRDDDNITSISVPDVKSHTLNVSHGSGVDSAYTNSTMNSSYSTNAESTKSSVSSKEKKRRRWGVFMGRTSKDVKSATLGRDKPPPPAQHQHRWSTGLPKSLPLPPSISKETLCQLIERKMADNQLSFAFEQIPKGRETGAEMTTALLPENAHLNGYSTNQLPYEDNRVKLQPTQTNKFGYVNASHITMTVGSTQRFYILAQFPPPPPPGRSGGAGGVWECAAAGGARVIARVGGGGKLPGRGETCVYGKFQITVESISLAPWGGTRRVRLREGGAGGGAARGAGGGAGGAGGGAGREVWHVSYDEGLTENMQHFLAFLSELSALRLSSSTSPSVSLSLGAHNAPLLLYSEESEGAGAGAGGAAGALLAADLLLHILDSNQELDIPRTISLLHQQRANMITNVAQYRFLHEVLLQYLKQSRLI